MYILQDMFHLMGVIFHLYFLVRQVKQCLGLYACFMTSEIDADILCLVKISED